MLGIETSPKQDVTPGGNSVRTPRPASRARGTRRPRRAAPPNLARQRRAGRLTPPPPSSAAPRRGAQRRLPQRRLSPTPRRSATLLCSRWVPGRPGPPKQKNARAQQRGKQQRQRQRQPLACFKAAAPPPRDRPPPNAACPAEAPLLAEPDLDRDGRCAPAVLLSHDRVRHGAQPGQRRRGCCCQPALAARGTGLGPAGREAVGSVGAPRSGRKPAEVLIMLTSGGTPLSGIRPCPPVIRTPPPAYPSPWGPLRTRPRRCS
jgi:hypothetical protein